MQTSLLNLLKRRQNYQNLFEHFFNVAYLRPKVNLLEWCGAPFITLFYELFLQV